MWRTLKGWVENSAQHVGCLLLTQMEVIIALSAERNSLSLFVRLCQQMFRMFGEMSSKQCSSRQQIQPKVESEMSHGSTKTGSLPVEKVG